MIKKSKPKDKSIKTYHIHIRGKSLALLKYLYAYLFSNLASTPLSSVLFLRHIEKFEETRVLMDKSLDGHHEHLRVAPKLAGPLRTWHGVVFTLGDTFF